MGVLNKLKSRMSSYRGPTQVDPTTSSPVYGFDTGRKRSSGVDAVNAGLAAGAAVAPVVSNVGQQIADAGSSIGSAIGAMGKSKRSESISKSKKAGKTGIEARAQWKKEKSDDLAARGKKAVDEGRDKKADRLLKRAAKNEDRSIELEEKAYHQKRKKNGSKKLGDFVSLESEDIAPILRSMPSGEDTEVQEELDKFAARFGNAPIIDENLK
tara:strand:+ start:1206 stop:1841 length:636 start_codon:yes stop_codon:yes gene_type:complete